MITGIGYQGLDLDVFVDRLVEQRVGVLADVRLTPISRKRGFSKSALEEAVTAVGIDYVHLRALGNPKDNRAGFGGGPQELADARARYAALLTGDAAQAALDRLAGLARDHHVAVLCFEADEHRCHRAVVLQEIQQRLTNRGT